MKTNPKLKICFDVDGTLIHLVGLKEDTPRYDVIALYKHFELLKCEIYIWSQGGVDYAEMWKNKLGLDGIVVEKYSFIPDIAIDDEEFELGKVNIRV